MLFPSLNFNYIIARIYFAVTGFFHYWWGTPESWRLFLLYINLFWSLLGLALALGLAYLVLLTTRTQFAHKKELMKMLIANWERQLNEQDPEEWQEILQALESENGNDWKLAIIKADTLLDGLTLKMNLIGNNLGERLKNANPGDLRHLNEAWEAHKIRNQIAHDGNFELSKYETRRVISLYERVFRELGYI